MVDSGAQHCSSRTRQQRRGSRGHDHQHECGLAAVQHGGPCGFLDRYRADDRQSRNRAILRCASDALRHGFCSCGQRAGEHGGIPIRRALPIWPWGSKYRVRRNSSSTASLIKADRVRLRSSRVTGNVRSIGAPNIISVSIPSIFSGHRRHADTGANSAQTIFSENQAAISFHTNSSCPASFRFADRCLTSAARLEPGRDQSGFEIAECGAFRP